MKKAGSLFFLISALFLCSALIPFPAQAASEADFAAAAVTDDGSGVLTLEDGQTWYRVKGFEDNADYLLTVRTDDGRQMLLTVSDGTDSQYIWNYSRSYMTASTEPRYSALSTGRYSLSYRNGELSPYYDYQSGDRVWSHEDSVLCFRLGYDASYLKYDPAAVPPFTMTADRSEASEVIIYSRSNTLARCIIRQPAAETFVIEGSGYPAPVFSVGLPDVTVDRIQWFADGDEQPCSECSFTADVLKDRPVGVHRVSCLIEAHDSDGVHYREQSADASFVIAKGVLPDSILTFSDIHEEYSLIPRAIMRIMEKTDGYIPSLVICSGDFVNGPTVDKDRELNLYFPQIVSALGGLDAVFVAGNHDSAAAASMMTASAGLGADRDLPPAGGVIFDGESAAAQAARNARAAKSILAYGINFDAAIQKTELGVLYSYERVIGSVEQFLQEAAEDYHGELIVISAHSGLHLIGAQPESVNYYDSPLREWLGENEYNIDLSYILAETINRYAEDYDMDIVYFFGHDHSRGEKELFLSDGDRLFSSLRYADRTYGEQTLHFTYANAGYLSSVIGAADSKFTLFRRTEDGFSYDLIRTDGVSVRHADIRAKHPYEEPVPAETTMLSDLTAGTETTETTAGTGSPETDDTAEKTASGNNIPGPDTGDCGSGLMLFIPAAAGMLLSRKRSRSIRR